MAVSDLTVAPEDPAGGEDAYIDIDYADTYHEDRSHSEWADASEDEKKVAIREATAYLDIQFDWIGEIADEDQDLDWPRDDTFNETLEDNEGRDIASNEIPFQVKQATAELALREITDGDLVTNDESGEISMVRAGSVSVEYQEDTGSPSTFFKKAHRLVDGLTLSKRGKVTRV